MANKKIVLLPFVQNNFQFVEFQQCLISGVKLVAGS